VISVLIADDQDLVREGLRMLLEAEPDLQVAGEAGDGAEAVSAARQLDPDVILMDVRMPRIDGIQATARLTRSGCQARILMLTTYDLDDYVYRAMKAGACGFLLKDASREQLAEGIRTVSAGHMLLAPSIIQRFIDAAGDPAPAADSARVHLSERELDVIRLIAQGLSNAEIAASLHISEATVKSHVARILDRLDLRGRVQITIFAYENAIVGVGRPRQPPPGGRAERN